MFIFIYLCATHPGTGTKEGSSRLTADIQKMGTQSKLVVCIPLQLVAGVISF